MTLGYHQNYDIDGNIICVVECQRCGNQVRRDLSKSLEWYSKNIECCCNPFYLNVINKVIIKDDNEE